MMSYDALTVFNFLLGLGVAWTCLCRLNAIHHKVRKSVRAQFVVVLAGSLASGFQPILFGRLPGEGQMLLTAAVLIMLLIGMPRWRYGPPADVLVGDPNVR